MEQGSAANGCEQEVGVQVVITLYLGGELPCSLAGTWAVKAPGPTSCGGTTEGVHHTSDSGPPPKKKKWGSFQSHRLHPVHLLPTPTSPHFAKVLWQLAWIIEVTRENETRLVVSTLMRPTAGIAPSDSGKHTYKMKPAQNLPLTEKCQHYTTRQDVPPELQK